jgi:hypothetical protein
MLEIEERSTRSHPVENSLWKGLRTCRKADYRMNECVSCKIMIPKLLRHRLAITLLTVGSIYHTNNALFLFYPLIEV